MTKRQVYIIGGAAGLALVILVTLIAYYRVKFKNTEDALAAEQASRITFEEESNRLGRELNQSQEEVAAKIIKIEILEETIGEIQQQAVDISKAKAKIEDEKRKLEEERKEARGGVSRFGWQLGTRDQKQGDPDYRTSRNVNRQLDGQDSFRLGEIGDQTGRQARLG